MEWNGLGPGFMLSPTQPFSQADKQQLLKGIPEVLWGEPMATPIEPVPNTSEESGGGAWPSRYEYKQKRKRQAILDDDEELIRLIAMALPEIIKRYQDG